MILGGIFMKKIFYSILLILVWPILGYAEVLYSPYSEVQETDEYLESSDLIQVEEIEKYRFYREEIVYDDGYYSMHEVNREYPFVDLENFIWSDFSNWQEEKIVENSDTNIEERIVHQYRKRKLVDKVQLNYVCFESDEIILKELKVKVKQKEVAYTIEGGKEDKIILTKDKPLVIQFEQAYDPIDLYLSLQVLTPSSGDFHYRYTLSLFDDEEILYEDDFLTHTNSSIGIYRFLNVKENVKNPLYEEKITMSLEKPNDNSLYLGEKHEYRYQEKKYKNYKIEKVYLEGYYTDANGIKDSEQKKIFYQYQTRNYIDFFDQLTFFDPYFDLSFLVKSSSYDLNACKIMTKNLENSHNYQVTIDCQGDIYERIYEVVLLPTENDLKKGSIEVSSVDKREEKKTPISNELVAFDTLENENNVEKEEDISKKVRPFEEKDWGKPLKKKSASFVFDYQLAISLSLMFLGCFLIIIGIKKYVDEKN